MNRLRTIPYKWLVAAAFITGLSMDLMDTTIVNVALPVLGKDFHTSNNTTLEWVVTGYLLSLAVWIPASGWIGDRFGTKKTFSSRWRCSRSARASAASPGTSAP